MDENFGQLIRNARKEQGLSQQQLADMANLDHTSISRIERGLLIPHRNRIISILTALRIEDVDMRTRFLLAGGKFASEDIRELAHSEEVAQSETAQTILALAEKLRAAKSDSQEINLEALEAFRETVGDEVFDTSMRLRQLVADSSLSKVQAKEILEKMFSLAEAVLGVTASPPIPRSST